jgi:hypothetical protein
MVLEEGEDFMVVGEFTTTVHDGIAVRHIARSIFH